ncbi:hypothetical protein LXL04_011008 [Taraxacum kok-saghyz]
MNPPIFSSKSMLASSVYRVFIFTKSVAFRPLIGRFFSFVWIGYNRKLQIICRMENFDGGAIRRIEIGFETEVEEDEREERDGELVDAEDREDANYAKAECEEMQEHRLIEIMEELRVSLFQIRLSRTDLLENTES